MQGRNLKTNVSERKGCVLEALSGAAGWWCAVSVQEWRGLWERKERMMKRRSVTKTAERERRAVERLSMTGWRCSRTCASSLRDGEGPVLGAPKAESLSAMVDVPELEGSCGWGRIRKTAYFDRMGRVPGAR